MLVKVEHSMVLSLKLGEEDIILQVPNPIYIYKVGDELTLNVMRPDRAEKFEIVKTKVVEVRYEIIDFGDAEQLLRVKLEKIE
jgi:hypothetical protein